MADWSTKFEPSTASNNIVIPVHASVVAGQYMVAHLIAPNGDSVNTIPSGWSLIRSDVVGSNPRSYLYGKVAGASEPASYTWVMSDSRPYVGTMVGLDDVDTGAPVHASGGQGNSASTSVTCPSITPSIDNCRLLAICCGTYSPSTFATCSPPLDGGGVNPMTELVDACTASTSAANRSSAIYLEELGAAGATGTRVGTLSVSSNNVGQLVALTRAASITYGGSRRAERGDVHLLRRRRTTLRLRPPLLPTALGGSTGALAGHAFGALVAIAVSAPTAVAAAGGDGAASGDLPSVTVSAPAVTATGAAAASGDLATVTVTAPAATASGGAEGAANGGLPTLVVSAPAASATGAAAATASLPIVIITAPTGVADNGAPVVGTGWRLKVRARGYRWRLAWRPLMSPTPFPIPVSPSNDAGLLVDEIEGYHVPSGAPLVYAGVTIDAYWSATPQGTTPLGAVEVSVPRNASTPRFAVHFEAAQVDAALTGLAEGTPVWLVLEGTADFRAAIEHVVRVGRVL